jgi:hypothetical protein
MDPLTFRSRLEGGRLLRTLGGLCLAAAGSLSGADLTLTVEPRWRQEALAVPSGPVTNDTGQVLHVTRFAALLSEVSLVRVNGDTVRLEGQFGSLDAAGGRLAFTLRGVPDGEYAGLEFRIGLAPDVNHGDPGRWPARHALNPLVNGLHWNWQGGYVFAALEGTWLDGATHRGFLYHLATDERIMAVRFQARYEVRGDTGVALALNLARVLAAHPLKPGDAGESTHSAPDDLLAPELAAALERAWFWLSSGPSALSRSASAPPGAPAVPASPEVTPYAFVVPAGFPQPALPVDNALTHEGIALGAALFNDDPRLSGPGNQSCASCHDAARAFSDAVAVSLGAEGRPGKSQCHAAVQPGLEPGLRVGRPPAALARPGTWPRGCTWTRCTATQSAVGRGAVPGRYRAPRGSRRRLAHRSSRWSGPPSPWSSFSCPWWRRTPRSTVRWRVALHAHGGGTARIRTLRPGVRPRPGSPGRRLLPLPRRPPLHRLGLAEQRPGPGRQATRVGPG